MAAWDWVELEPVSEGELVREVLLRLDGGPRAALADAGDWSLWPGDFVIVEGPEGQQKGEVLAPALTRMAKGRAQRRVARPVNRTDERRMALQQSREEEAFRFCAQRVRELGLPMKLVGVRYHPNGSRASFSFGSEDRVDFRQLVRDLAQRFHVRIDMSYNFV